MKGFILRGSKSLKFKTLLGLTSHNHSGKALKAENAESANKKGCEKNMDEEKREDEVSLEDTGEIDLPQLDLTPYIGKKAKIAAVTEHKGEFGYYVKIQTEVIARLTEKRKEPLELKASRIFSLQEDEEGRIGWGKETNLGLFLKKKGVKHYKDLVGKEVIVQTVTNKKQQRDFLSYN